MKTPLELIVLQCTIFYNKSVDFQLIAVNRFSLETQSSKNAVSLFVIIIKYI